MSGLRVALTVLLFALGCSPAPEERPSIAADAATPPECQGSPCTTEKDCAELSICTDPAGFWTSAYDAGTELEFCCRAGRGSHGTCFKGQCWRIPCDMDSSDPSCDGFRARDAGR